MIDIEDIYQQYKRDTPPISYFYKGIPNGLYDDVKSKSRLFIYDAFAYIIVSKLWIDDGDRSRLEEWLQVPWGTYPPLP